MATTTTSSGSIVVARRVVRTMTYRWPDVTFAIWLFVMMLCSSVILGILSVFVQIQQQLLLPIPWFVYLMLSACACTVILTPV